jgi:hypothetical protein
VQERYIPPETVYTLPFHPPSAIKLSNGVVLTNHEGYGEIGIGLSATQANWEEIDAVTLIQPPWFFEKEYLLIESDQWAQFLPYVLEYYGRSELINRVIERLNKNIFPIRVLYEPSPLTMTITMSSSFYFLPVYANIASNHPISNYRWYDEDRELLSLLDFSRGEPGKYTLFLKAEDVFGQTATTEVVVELKEYTPPVDNKIIFDRVKTGSKVLFVQNKTGVWNVLDQNVKGSRFSYVFDLPGEYTLIYASSKLTVRYRIIAE